MFPLWFWIIVFIEYSIMVLLKSEIRREGKNNNVNRVKYSLWKDHDAIGHDRGSAYMIWWSYSKTCL